MPDPGRIKCDECRNDCKTVAGSKSHVTIECKNQMHMAHDICGVLSMGIEHGDLVAISACGEDAEETIRNIGLLLHEDIDDVFNPMHSDNFQTALA